MKPFKLHAYSRKPGLIKWFILETTSFFDFFIALFYGQNESMELHQQIYKGNFIFGHGVMVVDYDKMNQDIRLPSMRTNNFMGVPIVANNSVFVVNSPLIALGEPFRTLSRQHLDQTIFTEAFYQLTYNDIKTKSIPIIEEWLTDKKASNILVMCSMVTRMVILLCEDIIISKKDAEKVTNAYIKHFKLSSLLKHYFPFISGAIGNEHLIKQNAFYHLKKLGVSNEMIDATLFAAMFSIGTLFTRCVDDIRRHNLNFTTLPLDKRKNFVVEAIRLYPTVTTTHRVVESPEEVVVAERTITLTEGDEMIYPFVCAHKDPQVFKCPHAIDVNRSQEDYDKVLSWSKGKHDCPARNFSILVTLVLLDALNEKQPLTTIDYKGKLF